MIDLKFVRQFGSDLFRFSESMLQCFNSKNKTSGGRPNAPVWTSWRKYGREVIIVIMLGP